MALSATRIHVGPGRIFVGVTAGASGTPPTYITHTDGVPSTGDQIGHTDGDLIFRYNLAREDLMTAQSLSPVDAFSTSEEAEVEFTAMEQTFVALREAFQDAAGEDVAGGEAFYFGGGNSILNPIKRTIFCAARERNDTGRFVVVVLYAAYRAEGLEMPFRKGSATTYKIRLRATCDSTRTAGDQLGYYRYETP